MSKLRKIRRFPYFGATVASSVGLPPKLAELMFSEAQEKLLDFMAKRGVTLDNYWLAAKRESHPGISFGSPNSVMHSIKIQGAFKMRQLRFRGTSRVFPLNGLRLDDTWTRLAISE